MKNKLRTILGLALCTTFFCSTAAHALNPETELLLVLLKSKGIISKEEAENFKKTIEENASATIEKEEHYQSVEGLAARMDKLEDAKEDTGIETGWPSRITFSGLMETQESYTKTHSATAGVANTTTNDFTLSKVELGVDARINNRVEAHAVFLYEEDDTEQITIDEGYLNITGGEGSPFFMNIGKMVIPFGRFESHFISDPVTLTLGETNESSLLLGMRNDFLELSAGAFNGTIRETNDNEKIDSFYASAVLSFPKETVPGAAITAGISYNSNLADSETMQDINGVNGAAINDLVGGFGAFASIAVNEKVFFDVEYVTVSESFQGGELAYATNVTDTPEPSAWNVELAFAVLENLELALKYEGSHEFDNVVPDEQYGIAVSYALFENTSVAMEYLRGEMKNKDDTDTITVQLGIEF